MTNMFESDDYDKLDALTVINAAREHIKIAKLLLQSQSFTYPGHDLSYRVNDISSICNDALENVELLYVDTLAIRERNKRKQNLDALSSAERGN